MSFPTLRSANLALALSSCAALVAAAQSLPVANPSFESPQVPPGFPASTVVDGWQKNPPPPPEWGITPDQWDQMAGIFPNPAAGQPRHIVNADGTQVAFVFAVPGVALTQLTANTFTAGLGYTLDVGLRGGGALTPGTQFYVGLFYTDGTSRTAVASTVVSATDELTNTDTLRTISVALGTVSKTDAWSGRQIGIELSALSPNGAQGIAYWEADSVRLTAVPEPSVWALGATGLLALGAATVNRRRK
jgi:hypothetical protein